MGEAETETEEKKLELPSICFYAGFAVDISRRVASLAKLDDGRVCAYFASSRQA